MFVCNMGMCASRLSFCTVNSNAGTVRYKRCPCDFVFRWSKVKVTQLEIVCIFYLQGNHTFYRTTLCVSAVFAIARCPSVTLVYYIHTAVDIVILLSRPSSPAILVFWPPALIPNAKGKGAKYTFAIFDWNRRLSRQRYGIGPWLLRNVNRKS